MSILEEELQLSWLINVMSIQDNVTHLVIHREWFRTVLTICDL